jgi:hypothetical protein
MYALKRLPSPLSWLALAGGLLAGVVFALVADYTSPLLSAGLVCGAVVAVVVLLFPALGFLLTSAVIPIERIGRLTSDSSMYTFSVMRIVGLLALGSFLLHALVRKWGIKAGLPFYLYAAYCAVGLLTLSYTNDTLGGVRAAGAILGNLMFLFLVVNLVRKWDFAKGALLVWLCASVLVGCYTIYDWHLGRSTEEQNIGTTDERLTTVFKDFSEWESLNKVARASGPTSHAAVYGINMILTLPFFAYLFRTQRSLRVRALVAGGWLIVIYNIFLTNTRAAIILAVLVMLCCALRKMLVITPAKLVGGLLSLAIMLAFVPADVYTRVLDLANYNYKQSSTLRARLDYWNAGVTVAEHNWLTGIGIGNQKTIPKYITGHGPKETSVHNEFLESFIEVGIFGWLLFFGFVGVILWSSFKAGAIFRRARDSQEQYWFLVACQIAQLSVLVYGVQVDVFHFPLKGWWLIAGLSWVMYRLARREELRAAGHAAPAVG